MDTQENKKWEKKDVVIHSADAKEAYMLMEVIGRTKEDRVKTKYIDKDRNGAKIWVNDDDVLLDPAEFGLVPASTDSEALSGVDAWNKAHPVGSEFMYHRMKVVTRGEAYLSGDEMFVHIKGSGVARKVSALSQNDSAK